MKKRLMSFLLALDFIACSDGTGVDPRNRSEEEPGDKKKSGPSAIDTMQHPNGITSGSVISRDTAAMRPGTPEPR